jgi:putative YhbY family RNA-binding protein
MDTKKLRAKGHTLYPSMQIGKQGITRGLITELQKQLKIKKIIKVKFMKSFIEDKDKKVVASDLAKKLNANIVSQTGNVLVLAKKGK